MNRTRRSWRIRLSAAILTGTGLAAAAACGGAGGSAPVNAPPASPHTAPERAATMNWLAKTNQMWTQNNFAALDQVTTGEMRTIYQAEQQGATPNDGSRSAFQLTGLSITVPCQGGVFVAYADTDVFTLGQGMQPVAMVFERVDGAWKLAAAVSSRGGSSRWPALCKAGTATTAPVVLAPSAYAPDLARVLTGDQSAASEATAAAAPFALNGFLSGPGSINAQFAEQVREDLHGAVSLTGGFTATTDPTFALALASGRGYWLVGTLIQSATYTSVAGTRKANWPDGNPVAKPRPAVVHHEADTFITTYTAIDPLASAGGTVALDGFFGWPLTAAAS
jgi:hypothetical protein